MTGRDVVRIFLKHKWLIILSILIGTGIACGATILWLLYAPFYTAEAYLQINPPKPSALVDRALLPSKQVMDRLTRSQAQLIKSDAVLVAATEDPLLNRTKWYRRYSSRDVIQELHDALTVASIPETFFVRIAMTERASTNKEQAELADIVNAVANAFVEDNTKSVRDDRVEQLDRLRKERDNLKLDLDQIRRRMSEMRPEDIPDIDDQRNVLNVQLQGLVMARTDLDLDLAEEQAAYDKVLEQERAGTLINSAQVRGAVEMNPTFAALRHAQVNLRTELDDALAKFGPQHRTVRTVETRMQSIAEQMRGQEQELAKNAAEAVKQFHQGNIEILEAQRKQIQDRYEALMARLNDAQANLSQLKQLAVQEKALEDRISKIEESELEYRLLYRVERPVFLRRQAAKPRKPSMPKWQVMVPLGVFFGVVVGVGLAFLLEVIDTSVKSPGDITRRIDLAVLGMVPHLDDVDEEIEDLRLTFMTNPNSLISESFRRIRTCLLFSGPPSGRRSLLVTSPMPEDGRSTVTLNLAGSVAQSGRKVLVVDTNFRQPVIRKLFPEIPEAGLSSALSGQANWRDLAKEVDKDLFLMSSGVLPPNPAELLGSDQMRNIISEMTDQFEQVFFDGAPGLVVADSSVLSSLVDGVILVVRAGANTHGIVERTRAMLTRVGAHIIGVVVNGVRVTAGGYYRRSYETFYEYHEQEQLPAVPAQPPAKSAQTTKQ